MDRNGRDRGRLLADHRAHRARGGARRGAARLRRGRAAARRARALRDVLRGPSERDAADPRRGDDPARLRDLRGRDAHLHRLRAAAAVARLGRPDRRQLPVPLGASGGPCSSRRSRSRRSSSRSTSSRTASSRCSSDERSDRRARAPRPRRRLHACADATGRSCAASRSRSAAASRTASSASRDAGSRLPRSRSSATCRETGASSGGSISVAGRDVLALGGGRSASSARDAVSMVYQNPGAALNPSIRVGAQVAEAFTVLGASTERGAANARATRSRACRSPTRTRSWRATRISSPAGMQQRAVIAMALAKDPALLILDEPTTGLDATVEAEVLDLVSQLQAELHTSVLFISHNLGVISKMCSRVGVLYAGRLVEEGPVETVLRTRAIPYTVGSPALHPARRRPQGPRPARHDPGLPPEPRRRSIPGCVFADRCALADERCRAEEPPLIAVDDGHESRCWYHEHARELPREEAADLELPGRRRAADAPLVELARAHQGLQAAGTRRPRLTEVSAAIWPGETLGLVGESGSGKTTLARTLLGIVPPTDGDGARSRGASCRPATRSARARSCARSRSSSRTPTRRSTAGTRSGGSCCAR